MRPLMKCGHIANAYDQAGPCCVICSDLRAGAHDVDPAGPDLTGRTATCYCGKARPSSEHEVLAFFEYRGPGSPSAVQQCKCGYMECAHHRQPGNVDPTSVIERGFCKGFEPRGPDATDNFYCGHAGWD